MTMRIPFRSRPLQAINCGIQAQRWASYDKSLLTKDALKQRVESGFETESGDSNISLDSEKKIISTSIGDLPLSPLFDPDWIQARRRQRKPNPSKPTGRFRKKLANNPYAQALATPLRRCPNTEAILPRYFLQDFEVVKHPQDDSLWWAPGPLAFENLTDKNKPSGDQIQIADAATAEQQPQKSGNDDGTPAATSSIRLRRSPITSYVLSRKSVVDMIGGPNRRYAASLLAARTGMAMAPITKSPVWRRDMSDIFLQMIRQQAVDALCARSGTEGLERNKLIQPCKGWEHVKDVELRGCVLFCGLGKEGPSIQYATLDIDGAKYGSKLPVYNLRWLLGESEFVRLRDKSKLFQENEILVLQQWKSK
ncbi:hypothetical protein ED733_008021 [Metarhizium rileyi]|uniref:Esterase-like protein n=1 Tax=Metarhizium rileyi (strain RCEF 4871) TaxID=1649241 RepID=A0A5C6GIJ8_METRR|nr:hypothetical protein ED733_008021 [Metarhizium rileyi]